MSNNDKKTKAIAYCRVSTLLKGQDPKLQQTNIQEFAKARGFDLVDSYIDEGIGGDRERRPQLDRLIRDARMGKFSIIIVTGIDRIGRSVKHLLILLDELKHCGVSLISIREQLDFSTPSGQLCLVMMAAVAQLEKQLISERIRSSLAAKKLSAQQSGSGWRCGRKLRATPAMIQRVMGFREKGLSIKQIETALNKEISRGTVQRILAAKQK